tara:strand:+ start:192 stop:482 length:291 start_codon:yes stop_codon:yes gene_type:complete
MNNKKRQQKLKRRLKRKKQKDKKRLDKDLQDVNNKIALFQRRPDECSACNKEFPEKDREAHMAWQVVVRNEEETVRLFCPDCQEKAKRVVENSNEV